jgi:hypothetical protein
MTAQRDLDRELAAFLREGPEELPYESFDTVRDRTEQTRQRVILGPWRLPEMNKILAVGIGAVAVVAVLLVGSQLFGPAVGGEPSPTPEPSATVEPTATQDVGLPLGPFLIFDPAIMPAPYDEGPPITVTIAGSGWEHVPENGVLAKGPEGDPDPPDGVGAFLLTGDSGADTFYVYGDPCHWESTTPETPATTVDEVAEALAAQASRDATAPVDVTLGGYSGKFLTLTVPMIAPTRAEAFNDCDQDTFATWGTTLDGPARYQQGPGQVDEIWILDVEGQIVILDAAYSPATPAALVDEIRAMVESATFEAP